TTLCNNYYVSQNGNDSDAGTFDNPWKSINKATNSIIAGDTVFIREGIYYEGLGLQNSGTAENKIVIKAYQNENVVVDGSNYSGSMFYIARDYIEIYNIKFRNGDGWGIISENCTGLKVKNCEFLNLEHTGIRLLNMSDVIISNNLIENVGEDEHWGGGIWAGFVNNITINDNVVKNSPAQGIFVEYSANIDIYNNYTYNTIHSGIHVANSDTIKAYFNEVVLACNGSYGECLAFQNCYEFYVFENEVHTSGITTYGGEGISAGSGSHKGKFYNNHVHDIDKVSIYVDGMHNPTYDIEVYNNIVNNTDNGIAVGSEQDMLVENITIRDNLVYNSGIGFNLASWVKNGTRRNIKVFNNTFYNNIGGIVVETGNIEDISIINNICSQNWAFQFSVADTAIDVAFDELEIKYNILDGIQWDDTTKYGSNWILENPEFVDTANFDFHLESISPAIDAGSPDNVFNDPDCTRGDIGAYYFNQNSSILPANNPVGDFTFKEDTGEILIIEDIRTIFTTEHEGTLVFEAVSNVSKIKSIIKDYGVFIKPANNYSGIADITLIAKDSCIYEARDTFAIEIIPVNDIPLIFNLPDTIVLSVDSLKEIILNDHVLDYDQQSEPMDWNIAYKKGLFTIGFDTLSSMLSITTTGECGGYDMLYCTATDDSLTSFIDSIIIKVNSIQGSEIEVTEDIYICEGENYFGWTESDTYVRTLEATSGCDSIITTNLTVYPVYNITDNVSICQGESYKGNTESGTYIENLQTVNSCDSIVTTNLTVNPVYNITDNISICQGESYKGHTESGTYIENLQTVNSCDSIVTTNLTVYPVYNITDNVSICQGESYKGHTESGTYIENLQTINDCDSIVTTNLTVNPVYNITDNISICQGESYKGHTESGTYIENLQTINDCDSIVTTNLIVNKVSSSTFDKIICEGESYFVGGADQTTASIYFDTLENYTGCDSIIITNLTINSTSESTIDTTICEGESYLVGDINQTISGTYYDTLQNVLGCDSVIITKLVVDICDLISFKLNETIKIYPNPASSIMTIESNIENSVLFELYNLSGTKILHKDINTTKQSIDISGLVEGAYICKLYINDKQLKYNMIMINR
ncbi:right-handed parallel beta-helix repeat-containing protein, partial [Bacteroidota bacterium]